MGVHGYSHVSFLNGKELSNCGVHGYSHVSFLNGKGYLTVVCMGTVMLPF